MFVDCYSRYTILVPASNHTANTVSDALRHVVPYFGTPCRLLSDRGREFVGEVWNKLTRSLGIQRLLASPYHPEGNSINEWSNWTINNMLRARLLDGTPSRTWADKIPGIMLALNAMAIEPNGFSASMIATGREPTLPPDVESNSCASPSLDDPASICGGTQKAAFTHPPTDGPTPSSCRYQPIPRRKPHIRTYYSYRAYQQSWPHDERAHSWSGGCPTLIRWFTRMVQLGEPSILTTPSQPNSQPQGSPHPYPHLNLLGQL